MISADGIVKIGDFGLSTGGAVDTTTPQSPTAGAVSMRSHLSFTTGVGSPLYCSPEQIKGERYDSKVDVSFLYFFYILKLFYIYF